FMVLIMLLLSTSVFLWSLSKNTEYNQAVKDKNQLEVDRLNEKVTASNVNYTISNNLVSVSVELKNNGPLLVQIATLWVYDATVKSYGFNNTLNITLKPGDDIFLSGNSAIKVKVNNANAADMFDAWFITGRGNVVPIENKRLIVAQVSAGIGAIAMDFATFKYYNVTKVGGTYVLNNYPYGASGYYIIQNSVGIAFSVTLTNFDLLGRNITLSSHSVFWTLFPVSPQQPRGSAWYIINVYANGTISNTFTSVILPYGIPTSVYFASAQDLSGNSFVPCLSSYTGTAPVNLALIGQIGDSPYGQNIPFASVYIS
ncbi:MAG: hypothetical protein ACPLW8_04095, partial [Candidatus Bathyarchaeales archaeon]